MDDSTKRMILQSILSSEKIKKKYELFRNNYKLNKRLIIERIINEIDLLSKRFKDNIKLINFLESYIANHIKDFLTPRRDNDNFSKDTTFNDNSKIPENPEERFKREMEQRNNVIIQKNPQNEEIINNESDYLNEENIEEKNETNNTEMMNRNFNSNNNPNQPYNPYLSNPQMNPINQQLNPMNQQMNPINQQLNPMNQQMNPMNQQLNPMNQQMNSMNQQMNSMNQQMNPMNQQMNPMNQQMYQQQLNNRNLQSDVSSNQQGYAPNRNIRRRNEPSLTPQQPLQQPIMTPQQPMMTPQQPMMIPQQPIMSPQQPIMTPQQPMITPQQPIITPQQQTQPQEQTQDSVIKEDTLERSLIHIDSRERDFKTIKCSNPFNIQMINKITCLICVKDLIVNNLYSDPYLLVQIMESSKGVYENQLNSIIHFKLVKVESNRDSSYYKNIDPHTMIRLRDINSITFNIIRPNGKVLYNSFVDLYDIKLESKEDAKAYLENKSVISEMSDKMELINVDNLENVHLEEGDMVNLFDKGLEDNIEYKVIYLNKKDNKILLETLENRGLTNFSKLLISKYQIAITLEII